MQSPNTLSTMSSTGSEITAREMTPFEARVQAALLFADNLNMLVEPRDIEVLTRPSLLERGGPQLTILNELESQVAALAGLSMSTLIELAPDNLFAPNKG